MKEIVTRPRIYKMWKSIERLAVPRFLNGYTVNGPIAEEFKKMYGCNYEVIRNIATTSVKPANTSSEKYILYQGAVNEGRSFETLIPAMKDVNAELIICGDGNFMQEARALVASHMVSEKVIFRGMVQPAELKKITAGAAIGITLFEHTGESNYYSLANRFFDYIQAGVPQLCVDFPVYREINNSANVAVLISDLSPASVSHAINKLLADRSEWENLHRNCLEAARIYNWEEEEKKLIHFYRNLFG